MAASDVTTPMAIVDSHHHVWDPAAHAQPWLDSDDALAPLRRNFSVADLAPQAAAAGVVSTVVVQTITAQAETPELLSLVGAGSLVAAVVGWTDLTAASVGDDLGGLRDLPGGAHLAGIRHPLLTEPDDSWLARSDVQRGLRATAAAGLTFDLVLRPGQLPAAVGAAASLPELTFALDHLGNVDVDAGPQIDESWAEPFSEFAALPNTVCKLSGILSAGTSRADSEPDQASPSQDSTGQGNPGQGGIDRLRPYVDLALEHFGPGRLMFGSDWPVCTLSASYADVVTAAVTLTLELSDADRYAILAGTARRVYRIPSA
jgi:L-fuconolactonase